MTGFVENVTLADYFMTSVSTDNYSVSPGKGTLLPLLNVLSPVYRVVGGVLVTVIFAVGLVGNVMVVVVVWRAPSMHTPTNYYLVSLALADIILLISAPLPTIVEMVDGVYGKFVLGSAPCALMVFAQYLGVNVSSLSIGAFTVERYIAICHPMRAQHICTVRRAKRIIGGLWTFGLLYCLPWLGLATTVPRLYADGTTAEFCQHKLPRNSYVIYYIADLVLFYVIPLIVTCVLYALMSRVLCSGRLFWLSSRRSSRGDNCTLDSSLAKSRLQASLTLSIKHLYTLFNILHKAGWPCCQSLH